MALQCITVYMDVKFIAAQPGWTYYDGRLFSSEAQYGEEKFTGVLCVRHVCQAEMPSFASLHPLWLGGPASTPLPMHKPRPRLFCVVRGLPPQWHQNRAFVLVW